MTNKPNPEDLTMELAIKKTRNDLVRKYNHLTIESAMKETRDDFLRKYIRMQLEEYKKENNINE